MVDPRRAQVFGEDAETYDAARPTYPAGVIDVITRDAPVTAVDVGCGTGKAARLVAERGVDVIGVEPDARMASVARRHGVIVHVGAFEDWEPVPRDVVFSGQAWHWVDPVRGAVKAADVLGPGGRWAAFWNREVDPTVQAALAKVYARWAPDLEQGRDRSVADGAMATTMTDGFAATGAFGDVARVTVVWIDRVSVATLVARLSTHSRHRLLAADAALAVHQAITDELGGPDEVLELEYTTLVLTTLRH